MNLIAVLRAFFLQQDLTKTFWLAFSGGVDSQVLLTLCYQLRQTLPLKLQVIHVNHGIHPQAANWEKACAEVCRIYNIAYQSHVLTLKLKESDLENAARVQRYAVFAKVLGEGDIL